MQCPKCNTPRNMQDMQCPSCGVWYAKVEAALERERLKKQVVENQKNEDVADNRVEKTPESNHNFELSIAETTEAQQYHLKAQFILNELHANIKVYGSDFSISGAPPVNIDIALQYIERSLEIDPENSVYLNLKALLLWEGLGKKQEAIKILEKALLLNPRDIDIQNNLYAVKKWKPAKITFVGYIGIMMGVLIVFLAFSTSTMDSSNFFVAMVGFAFISYSFYGARR